MSSPIFNGKVVLSINGLADTSAGAKTSWLATFSFTDNTGMYFGSNAAVGDAIILDTGADQQSTITSYTITSIVSTTFSSLTVNIDYDSANANPSGAPDLSACTDTPGVIIRRTGLKHIAGAPYLGIQLIPDVFQAAIANDNSFNIIDKINGTTNLTATPAASSVAVGSSTGTGTTLAAATGTVAGVMTAADKTKLDGIATGANNYSLPIATASVLGGVKAGTNITIDASGVISGAASYTLPTAAAATLGGVKVGTGLAIDGSGVLSVTATGVTNLSNTPAASTVALASSTGTGTTLAAATGTVAGVMTAADKTKLDGIATGATANTGTVTTVSVATANGVSGTVATATSTPAITLTLGAITPTSVAATGNVTGANLSGSNTGDQTITLTGDVTGTGTGSFATTLANSGVTAGTYEKVTVNAKGLVTAGAQLSSADVITALGYTPGTGGGSVSTVSVVTANGVSGTVATATSTPAITLTLGAITPTSVTSAGDGMFGNGTGSGNIVANGMNSGLAGGAAIRAQVGGANVITLGNASAVLGGTYDATATINAASTPLNIAIAGVTRLSVANIGTTVTGTLTSTGNVTGANLSGTNTGDQTITLTGDVTGTGTGSFAATLKNTGTAGTYTKVTTDAQGRVTTGAQLAASDITTALTFTPYNVTNPAGYQTAAQVSALITAGTYSLPTASTTVLGGVKIDGTSITIASGVISATAPAFSAITGKPTTLAGYGITDAVNTSALGANSGVATLGSDGKLTASQVPTTLIGGMSYQGTWNASTNTPTIVASTGTKGYYYKVSVAGTTSIDGNANWTAGDMIAFDGTTWDQIQGGSADVYSVNGSTGAVTVSANLGVTTGASTTTITSSIGTSAVIPAATTTVAGVLTAADKTKLDGIAAGASTGTVTSVSVVTANGVSGTVATSTVTPAITLTLGAITPTSVAATGAVSGSNLSGSNTGDQTITLTGDVTGTGTGSFATTLANSGVTAGSYTRSSITVDSKGRVTAASNGPAINLAFDVTGNLPMTNLASGTNASSTTFLRGDGTWAAPAAPASSGFVQRKVVVQNNGINGTVVVNAFGSQSDLNSITIAVTGGNLCTISGVPATLQLQTISFHYASGFNATTGFAFKWPEVFGDTTDMFFTMPVMMRVNEGGSGAQTFSNVTISNVAGVIQAQQTGLTANIGYSLKVTLI
jgi:hypothetical protein